MIETPKDLGWGMEGMGDGVMRFVDEVASCFDKVTYVEIGVHDGLTLCQVAKRLSVMSDAWRAVGIDLPSCRYQTTQRNSTEKGLQFKIVSEFRKPVDPKWNTVTFYLRDSQSFLSEYAPAIGDVHLALIDGCHGHKCVSMDFLLIEPMMVPGGYVMFHDFGKDQIGQEQSPPDHCPIVGVHNACKDLGLLDNSRPDWRFVQTIIGDKHRYSADMGVFQKV